MSKAATLWVDFFFMLTFYPLRVFNTKCKSIMDQLFFQIASQLSQHYLNFYLSLNQLPIKEIQPWCQITLLNEYKSFYKLFILSSGKGPSAPVPASYWPINVCKDPELHL